MNTSVPAVSRHEPVMSTRREWLRVTSRVLGTSPLWSVGALGALGAWASGAAAASAVNSWQAALSTFAQGAPVQSGRVSLIIDAVVENGHTVPVTLSYAGPAPGPRVQALALLTERNPAPEVVEFGLSPLALPRVQTRLRLATSQGVWAAARLADGSCWAQRVEVLVTLAACVEEL